MPETTQLTSEQLVEKKARIAKQQADDLQAATDSDADLHRLADEIHTKALGTDKPQSFADSLKEAATQLLQENDLPAAARDNLLRYAPEHSA